MDISDYKLPGEKKKKVKKPTLRFELDLPDSTDTSCPEYSYVDLVRQTLKERESKGQNDTLCSTLLEEEEERERDEAKAIAQFFEIKYGAMAAGRKRKRKDEVRDLVGAGYGYDDDDPFVDDSEAYDEIVPATMTTQHGGFYINKGKLNFRAVSDESDAGSLSDDSIPLSRHVAKKKKKLKLLDSDESGNEFKNGENFVKKRKKKLKSSKDPDKKKLKVSLHGKDKVPGLKQRTKKMKKSTSLAQKLVAKAKAHQMMNASGASAHSANGVQPIRKSLSDADSFVFKMNPGELGHLGNGDLAQVAKNATQTLMKVGQDKNANAVAPCSVQNGISSSNLSSAKAISHELPPNLPQMLGDKIESLKKIAQSNEVAGKMKFFSNDVNRILLGIEESAQSLPNKKRQGMYQHLAQHLPCSKDTLLKRVRKLQEDDSDQQLKEPVSKLKAAIDAVMKSQIEAYLLECDTNRMEKFPAAPSTDEDDEGEDKGGEASSEKKRNYAPRRKFKWDDNLRQLLCDVVQIKVNFYEKFKSRFKQGAEEYLKAFLDSAIKPLWPKPWMQTRTLFKESRSAHERLTNLSSKPKKAANNKKAQTPSNKDGKVLDYDVGQKADTKNYVAISFNLNDDTESLNHKEGADELKKRLSSGPSNELKLNSPPVLVKSKDSTTTVSVVKPAPPKTKPADGRGGGVDMVASIGEDFEHSNRKNVSSKVVSSISKEASKQWKFVSGHDVTSKTFTASPPSVIKVSSTAKNREKIGGILSKSSATNSSVDLKPPPMDLMKEYASDFVKMMMSGSQGSLPNPYLNSSGVPHLDALSHLLDRKPEIAPPKKPKTPVTDGKFQFKIASSSTSNSSYIEKAQRSLHPGNSSKKHAPVQSPTQYNVGGWSPLKKSPMSGSSPPNSAQKFATSPTLPGRSMAAFHDSFTSKTASALTPGFVMPTDVQTKYVTQRKQKHTASPKSNIMHSQASHGTDSNPCKSSKPSPSTLNSMQIPASMGAYLPDTSTHSIHSPHPVSPILLSPYSSSGMAFSPGFSPSMPPFASSQFKQSINPVCAYPAVSLQNLTYGAHSYPQVKLVDVKNMDLKKHISDGLHNNQDR